MAETEQLVHAIEYMGEALHVGAHVALYGVQKSALIAFSEFFPFLHSFFVFFLFHNRALLFDLFDSSLGLECGVPCSEIELVFTPQLLNFFLPGVGFNL